MNRLQYETSPYLLQHKNNPVDWYPWGDEALRKAKHEDKPIFLSIGYSACHWCHVMERESFENAETARLMNQSFVNIKVDREERPDLDHIYMIAVQALTQHGGWPMSVFLTPNLEPFYGGTYFPPEDRMGLPSFSKVLIGIASAWKNKNDEVLKSASQITSAIREMDFANHSEKDIDLASDINALLSESFQSVVRHFDSEFGGIGSAPKFFHTMDIRRAIREWGRRKDETAKNIFTTTLDHWSRGGIFDQLGGGFHRYSTDQVWLVPHFEKMLYDNALVSQTFLEAYQATGEKALAETARDTLDYILREMTAEKGGFFSTQDADSEGDEGKFFVWDEAEVRRVLDPELAEQFCYFYDVTPQGNWEGKNILRRKHSVDEAAKKFDQERGWFEESMALARRKLFFERTKRIPPARDEKILTSWNGLMIDAMALGYATLGDDRYLSASRSAALFLLNEMRDRKRQGSPLLHCHKNGFSRLNGYLDDYACFLNGLITLLEVDPDPKWVEAARSISELITALFWDEKSRTYFYTSHDHETLVVRPRESHDGATPSATAMALTALARFALATGDNKILFHVETALRALAPTMQSTPLASGQLWIVAELLLCEPQTWILFLGKDDEENARVLASIRSSFSASRVLLTIPATHANAMVAVLPVLKGKHPINEQPTLFICHNFVCDSPVSGADAIVKKVEKAR